MNQVEEIGRNEFHLMEFDQRLFSWIIREYEKLKRSSKGLTFDSITGWLNSHIGLVGEKKNVIKLIKEHDVFTEYNVITDSIFKAVYNHFYDKQQEVSHFNRLS